MAENSLKQNCLMLFLKPHPVLSFSRFWVEISKRESKYQTIFLSTYSL
jgi:hypothetical protein